MSKKKRSRVADVVVTFDVLTVCWSKRTVEVNGRTITAPDGPDCLVVPLTNAPYAMTRKGWYPA